MFRPLLDTFWAPKANEGNCPRPMRGQGGQQNGLKTSNCRQNQFLPLKSFQHLLKIRTRNSLKTWNRHSNQHRWFLSLHILTKIWLYDAPELPINDLKLQKPHNPSVSDLLGARFEGVYTHCADSLPYFMFFNDSSSRWPSTLQVKGHPGYL